MKFALGCLLILVELFAVSGLVVADAKEEKVTTSSGIVRPDGTIVMLDDGDYPDEEVLLADDADGVPAGKVEIVTSVTAISSFSDDDIDPNLEEWAIRATGGEIKRPRYNRRLKSRSKRKLKIAIGLITSGVDICKKEPYISDLKTPQRPTIVDAHKCHCFLGAFCQKCCHDDYKKRGDKCWGRPYDTTCPNGYKKEQLCRKCEFKYEPSGPGGVIPLGTPAGNGPGGKPLSMPAGYDESVKAEGKERQEYVEAQEVEAQMDRYCPPGHFCAEHYYECQKWENTHCSNFHPTIFTIPCSLDRFCGTSNDACQEKHWDFFKFWAEFVLNMIPGGKGTTKLVKKLAMNPSKRALRKTLQYMGRKAVRDMKKKFKKELKELKNELRSIVKDEVEDQVEAIIDDVLVELSIEVEAEEQDDPNVAEKVKDAFLDFANDMSPFDFQAFMELEKSTPACAEVSLRGDDMEFEDPEDGLVNVAIGKTTEQSSNYINDAGPELAVDGNLSGEWIDASVTHTKLEYEPFWSVDLGRDETIRKIIIHNRTDCCQDRLRDFKVQLLKDRQVYWSARYREGTPNHVTIFEVDGIRADKVKVSLPGRSDYLSLAEVEVIADA